MESQTSSKKGHRQGVWFTTQKPESTDLTGWGGTGDGVILVVGFYVAYALFAGLYRIMFWRTRSPDDWTDYQGMVFCQIYNNDLRFFKTVRNTSRVVVNTTVCCSHVRRSREIPNRWDVAA